MLPSEGLSPKGIIRVIRISLVLVAIVVASSVQTASAQNTAGVATPPAADQIPDHGISGFWLLRFDSRNIPQPALLPSLTGKQISAAKAHDAHAIRWCLYQGTPAMMDSGAPINILEGSTQVVVAAELPSAARHIYTDRIKGPDMATFDETPDGFSIGHWEGGDLIVQTNGFSDTGYIGIPGGGFRTKSSQLLERYHLVDGGKELEVTFTWTDPKVYTKPHTYAFRYYRFPSGFNANEHFCDSNDHERSDFLTQAPVPVKLSSTGSESQGAKP